MNLPTIPARKIESPYFERPRDFRDAGVRALSRGFCEMTRAADNSISHLTELPPRLIAQAGMSEVLERLHEGRDATIDGAWGSSTALAAVALSQQSPSSLIVVLPHERDVDEFTADVASFGVDAECFPSWTALPQELSIIDPVLANRLRILRSFESAAPPRIVVTTIHALLQPVPDREARTVASRTIRTGGELDLNDLTEWLIARGFERVTAIELPGEFCIHGGIVDLFSPDMTDPIRIELFGDEIESIRLFDVETQRKLKDLDEIAITVVAPFLNTEQQIRQLGGADAKKSDGNPALQTLNSSALDSFPATAWMVLVELSEIVSEGKRYLDRLADPRGSFSVESMLERCTRRPHVMIAPLLAEVSAPTCHLQMESIERFGGPKGEALQELARVVQKDEQVLIACHNEAAQTRLRELLSEVFLGERVKSDDGKNQQGGSIETDIKKSHQKRKRIGLRWTHRRAAA
jgi:transcription-repair coupling factor (superfamily II helicase)